MVEHHSRDFSINMAMEHLTITGYGVMNIIDNISKEQSMPQKITIQAVKPHENSDDSLSNFIKFTDTYTNFAKNLEKRVSSTTANHPWFGPFDNFTWYGFMAIHTFVHRRQIETILKNI